MVDSGVFGRLHPAFSLYPACAATPGLRRRVVNGNVVDPTVSAELHPAPSVNRAWLGVSPFLPRHRPEWGYFCRPRASGVARRLQRAPNMARPRHRKQGPRDLDSKRTLGDLARHPARVRRCPTTARSCLCPLWPSSFALLFPPRGLWPPRFALLSSPSAKHFLCRAIRCGAWGVLLAGDRSFRARSPPRSPSCLRARERVPRRLLDQALEQKALDRRVRKHRAEVGPLACELLPLGRRVAAEGARRKRVSPP